MNKSRYFKIGLFVLIGLGLICAAVVVLGAGKIFEKHIAAETLLDESVDGLEPGAQVKYRGVTIGHVTSIVFAQDKNDVVQPEPHEIAHYVLVGMALDTKSFQGLSFDQIQATFSRMVKKGLRARISQQGLTGGMYIGLDFAQRQAPALPNVHLQSDALYIPSAPSTMNQVMSAADKLASDLRNADLPRVIQHVDTLITTAASTVQHVNEMVKGNQAHITAAVSDLPAITGGLKGSVARAEQILDDKRIDRTLGNVAESSASARETINDLRRTSQELQSLIAARQEDIQRIIGDLRRTADNLAAMSVDARDNPSRLLFSGPPPRKEPGE